VLEDFFYIKFVIYSLKILYSHPAFIFFNVETIFYIAYMRLFSVFPHKICLLSNFDISLAIAIKLALNENFLFLYVVLHSTQ
jgi:hypothetical protein